MLINSIKQKPKQWIANIKMSPKIDENVLTKQKMSPEIDENILTKQKMSPEIDENILTKLKISSENILVKTCK